MLTVINPNNKRWCNNSYILCFGAYGDTKLLAYGNSLEDALDECVDWIAENAPELLVDDEVALDYRTAINDGKSEEEATELATLDTICAGNSGHYLLSWEWSIVAENPSKNEIIAVHKGAR